MARVGPENHRGGGITLFTSGVYNAKEAALKKKSKSGKSSLRAL